MSTGKKITLGLIFSIILVSIPLTLFLLSQQQDTRSRASEDAACTAPSAVFNVSVNYPYAQGEQLDFSQASCTWSAVADALNYSVTVTQVESGANVKTESVSASTTQIVFPVENGKTYRCDVSAVNACGSGTAGTDTKLCETTVLPTPTLAPTNTPVPTATPPLNPTATPPLNPTATPVVTQPPLPTATPIATSVPKKVVVVTMPPPGNSTTTAVLGIGALAFSLLGVIFLFVL